MEASFVVSFVLHADYREKYIFVKKQTIKMYEINQYGEMGLRGQQGGDENVVSLGGGSDQERKEKNNRGYRF